MTTTQIQGFFSKEHSVLVVLLCLSLWGNWKLYVSQNEIKAEIKLINYRLDNGYKQKPEDKKLAMFNIHGCERKPEFKEANSLLACFFRHRERLAKGRHRIY